MFRNYTRALRPSIRLQLRAKSFSTALKTQQQIEAFEEPAATRFPLSVQAIYYKPLHRLPKYGLPVCDLHLRSFSVRQLDFQCDFALRAAYYLNLPASGAVPLPKKIERWTVPRSNFVHKKSQENYERITYKRLIQIKDGNPDTVELWLAFLKKHGVYGVGMKANVWQFEEIGVGKTMKISLENLHDTKRPKWAHFGPRKIPETAAKVRDLLENKQYKTSESEAAGSPSDHVELDVSVSQIPSLPATLKGVKKVESDMTNEELRLRELEVEVAEAHAKDYLAQAVEGQRKAEERLVETQETLTVELREPELQAIEALKETMVRPSKVELQHGEIDFTTQNSEVELQRGEVDFTAQPSNVTVVPQRSEADTLRNLELQRALEARAAAEARAAEESRRTAEFQASLLAQFAAMQAELAALKAERAAEKMQKYIQPNPASAAPAPSEDIKREESETFVQDVPSPKLVGELSPKPKSVSVHIPEKRVEAILTPPEAPAMGKTKEERELTKPKSESAEISAEISQWSPPKLHNESFIVETVETQAVGTPEVLPEKPDLGSISGSITENVGKHTYGAFPIEAPAEKVEALAVEAPSEEVKAQVLSEESMVTTTEESFQVEVQQEELCKREVLTEKASPVGAQTAKEAPIGKGLVVEEYTNLQEVASESQSISLAEDPPSSDSYNTTETIVRLQMQGEEKLHPGGKFVSEDLAVGDLPLPSKAPEAQDAMKEQPEVTRGEEPAPEKQEKPKGDKPPHS